MKAVKCLLCTLLCLSPALGFAQVQKTWVVANVSGTTFSSWTHGFALGQSTTANFSAAWASQTYASASSLTGGVTIGSPTGWSASIALFKPAVSPSQFFFGN
jgi:hypothetical protein